MAPRNEIKFSESRAMVIESGVKVELLISLLLRMLLVVKKEDPLSFGNKSTSLTFMSKVNLLLDLERLPDDMKTRFIAFAEIRNKFAHVMGVNTFERGFAATSKKNAVLDLYGLKNEGLVEFDYSDLFFRMHQDIIDWLIKTFNEASRALQTNRLKDNLVDIVRQYAFDDRLYDDGRTFLTEQMRSVLTRIAEINNEAPYSPDFGEIVE